jgi:hypothetical protein
MTQVSPAGLGFQNIPVNVPAEGPKAVPVFLDFSKDDAYVIDLSSIQFRAFISQVASVFIDASGSLNNVECSVGQSNQNITAKAGSQGYYQLLSPNNVQLTFTSVLGGPIVTVFLVNVPIPTATWTSVDLELRAPLINPNTPVFTHTNWNTGAGVVTTLLTFTEPFTLFVLEQSDTNSTGQEAIMQKAPIAARFTLTVAVVPDSANTDGLMGLWIGNTGTRANVIFGLTVQVVGTTTFFGLRIVALSDFKTSVGDLMSPVALSGAPGIVWLSVQETTSTRAYFISQDGFNFFEIFNEPVNTRFTTNGYGVVCEVRSAAQAKTARLFVYSVEETSP